MTDKELIKQEIERRIKEGSSKNDISEGALALDSLLDFIDSLPEEPTVKGITWEDVNTLESLIYQVHNEYPSIGEKSFGLEVLERFQDCQDDIEEPETEDLEKEFHSWMRENCDDNGFFNQLELARHFAEWGRNHFEDKSEMVSEDLEEKITKCYKSQIGLMMTRKQFGEIIHRFTEWQKQKDQETIELAEDHAMLAGMNRMKEEMMENAVEGRVQCGYGDGNKLSIKAMLPQDSDLKYADKVKVLILKTE